MIKVSNLSIDYGNQNGIFDINITIPYGQICAVIGHSGCGKSTLLNALAGLLKSDSGQIQIKNQANDKASLGLIQQNDALFPWLKAWENVAVGLKETKEESYRISKNILTDLGLEKYVQAYPYHLSGGQRQRVSIARTLVVEPDVLLMDEPTASLDAFSKESLQDLLLTLHQKSRRTTLFVTHNIEEALFLADIILIMDKGRIVKRYENTLKHSHSLRDDKVFYAHVKVLRDMMKSGANNE